MDTLTTVNKILSDSSVIEGFINSFYPGFATNSMRVDMVSEIRDYFVKFKKDIQVVVEDYYVDRVYRNLYSHFFATKLREYGMYCVRLLLFSPDINIEEAFSPESGFPEKLASGYLGFVVLRPISPGVIGRSVINPKAKDSHQMIQISTVNVRSSALGYKIMASGFPHSSQDEQYLTCAETTIWSIMEYYGNKYPEYCPILPSKIHHILSSLQSERDVPSSGLDYSMISTVLKDQGFGCVVYSNSQKSKYDTIDIEFYRIFSCYVESGIPFAVSVNDCVTNDFGHAVVCIGEEKVERTHISAISSSSIIPEDIYPDPHVYKHWTEVRRRFVFNDDNVTPYALVDFCNPCPQYSDVDAVISNIVIPLHKKIYLDASRAMELAEIVASQFLDIPDDMVIRTILVSTNSYLDFIVKEKYMPLDLKEFLIGVMRFPKFLWVTEIADEDSFKNSCCTGLILLDATEPLVSKPEASILFGAFDDFMIYYNIRSQQSEENSLSLPFKIESYQNLQSF